MRPGAGDAQAGAHRSIVGVGLPTSVSVSEDTGAKRSARRIRSQGSENAEKAGEVPFTGRELRGELGTGSRKRKGVGEKVEEVVETLLLEGIEPG